MYTVAAAAEEQALQCVTPAHALAPDRPGRFDAAPAAVLVG